MFSPQANWVHLGEDLDYTPASDVVAGQVIVIGSNVYCAKRNIKANVLGAVAAAGVFDIVKDTSPFSDGDAVYWNATGNPVGGTAGTGAATSSASGNTLIGGVVPAGAALTGDATVRVKLSATKRTATIAGSVTADDITGSDSSLAIVGSAGAGNNNGGAIVIAGGAKAGTGTDGTIVIGSGNTSSVTFSKNPRFPVGTVAVGGTAIGNANALAEGFNLVTGADNTAAVILPASVAGIEVKVKSSTSGKVLIVFPPVGSKINGTTANTAYNHANLALRTYYCYNATDWFTAPETPT